MKVALLATHALWIKYSGDETVHTMTVVGDGGTGSAGLLTLTDATAHELDLGDGSYSDIDDLVTAICALPGWTAMRYGLKYPHLLVPIGAVDVSAASLFTDAAAYTVGDKFEACLEFASATETIAAGGTAQSIARAMPVNVEQFLNASVQCSITGANAGSSGDVDFVLVAASPVEYRTFNRSFLGGSTYEAVHGGGTHSGDDDASTLTDENQAWAVNSLVGMYVVNVTDGSAGRITSNTATTITATLSGGTGDDWDTDDVYLLKDEMAICDADWDTDPVDSDTLSVALSGTSNRKQSFTLGLGGLAFIKIGSVINNDPTYTCTVSANLAIDAKRPYES